MSKIYDRSLEEICRASFRCGISLERNDPRDIVYEISTEEFHGFLRMNHFEIRNDCDVNLNLPRKRYEAIAEIKRQLDYVGEPLFIDDPIAYKEFEERMKWLMVQVIKDPNRKPEDDVYLDEINFNE